MIACSSYISPIILTSSEMTCYSLKTSISFFPAYTIQIECLLFSWTSSNPLLLIKYSEDQDVFSYHFFPHRWLQYFIINSLRKNCLFFFIIIPKLSGPWPLWLEIIFIAQATKFNKDYDYCQHSETASSSCSVVSNMAGTLLKWSSEKFQKV